MSLLTSFFCFFYFVVKLQDSKRLRDFDHIFYVILPKKCLTLVDKLSIITP